MTIIPELTPIRGSARLTLRLRTHDEALVEEALRRPERLRAFRRHEATGKGIAMEGPPVEVVDFGGRKSAGRAVVFSIEMFGTYLVALERDR